MRVRSAVGIVSLFLVTQFALLAQSILTIAGGGTDDGRPATLAGLSTTFDVALDSAGNLFVVDRDNDRIRKVAAGSGIITTVAGSGFEGFSGDGGPATAAGLRFPNAVALDSAGNLYIADEYNHRIRRVAAGSGIIRTVAGNGHVDFSGDGGPATAAGLSFPAGVALDSAGNLYIADQNNNRIRKVAADSGIITTVAGNGSDSALFTPSFSGDGGPATAAGLSHPSSVALDSAGNLYIAGGNNRIRRVRAGSGIITTVAGNFDLGGFEGDGGAATAARLAEPLDVSVDTAGNLFIADSGNQRIRRVEAESGIITTVAGSDDFGGFSGDGGAATAARLRGPRGVAVDSSGNLFIADNHNYRIRKVTAGEGIIATIAGKGSQRFDGDGGPATASALSFPQGIAVDPAGNLYVADTGNNRVREVAAGSGMITTVAGSDSFSLGDGGAATAAGLFAPRGLAVDGKGSLYIADSIHYRIRKVEAGTGIITTVAGDGSPGSGGDGGPATAAQFMLPFDLALDLQGNLYIADPYDHRIRKIGAGSGIITTIAGNGAKGDGFGTYGGDGGPATAAGLGRPFGVAVDSAGNVYIADTLNVRIRKVAASSGMITTVAGMGFPAGPGGDGGAATECQLFFPSDVALDSAGNLYIADDGNNRIRKVAAGSGIITTIAGSGMPGFSGDGGAATAAGLGGQSGLAVTADPSGNLYITDIDSNRIRIASACVVVARPELTLPSDGVPTPGSSVKLAWKPVPGAFSYDVYLDKVNPPRASVAADIGATSYPASNLDSTSTYYWKIVAKGDAFCPSPSSASSEVRSFVTANSCGPAAFH